MEAWKKMIRSIRGQSASECVAILGVTVLAMAASLHPFGTRVPEFFAFYGSAGAAAQVGRASAASRSLLPAEIHAALESLSGHSPHEFSGGDELSHLRA